MTGWQPPQHDPGQQPGAGAPQVPGPAWPQEQSSYGHPQHQQVQPYQPQPPAAFSSPPRTGLTGAQQFWYVMQCIAFGAGYFAKIPAKKALSDFGMVEMTGAEKFWYVLQCIALGAGYFAKLSTAKALSEMPQFSSASYR